MNPVLILTRNCLELTKRCVESVRGQDVPTTIHIYDNESADGTRTWLETQPDIIDQSSGVDLGVSAAWNFCLDMLFSTTNDGAEGWNATHVLVINNDTELSPWTYRELLSYDEPFVTGVSVDHRPTELPPRCPLVMHPDFSCFLIRRDAWERVGPFDERMRHYASDNDWHVRAHRAGVRAMKANVPFYHERSSTLRLASPAERAEIEAQANRDRAVFREKWGCSPWEPEYEQLFK